MDLFSLNWGIALGFYRLFNQNIFFQVIQNHVYLLFTTGRDMEHHNPRGGVDRREHGYAVIRL